jgi:hypothetical protein
MRFVLNGDYSWIFLIFFGVFVGVGMPLFAFGHPLYAIISLPILGAFLLVSQIRSGIALDSFWRARYPRESWQFKAILALNVFGFVLTAVLAWYFWRFLD